MPVDDPEALMNAQRKLCEDLGLTSRVIIAGEGINGTLEGTDDHVQEYVAATSVDERFADVDFKTSQGTGSAFPKLSVRVRDECFQERKSRVSLARK